MDNPTRISHKPSQKNKKIITKTIKNTVPKVNTKNLNIKRATFSKPKETKQKLNTKKDIKPLTSNSAPKPAISTKQHKTNKIKEQFGPHGGRTSGHYDGRGSSRPSRPSRPSRTVVRNYYNNGYGGYGSGWGGYGGWGLDWTYPYVYPVEVPVTINTSESDKQQVKNEIKEELRRDIRPIKRNYMENQIIMILIGLVIGALLYKVFTK